MCSYSDMSVSPSYAPACTRFLRGATSDRYGCPRPLAEQVARLAGVVDALILREKDLDDGA